MTRGWHMRMYPLPPPLSGSWAPYPGFVIPLSFHLKLICEPILLDFDVDVSSFCLYNFHQIILSSLFIEGAPRGGLYGITPKLVAGVSMDRSPFRMCSCQTSQVGNSCVLVMSSTESHMKDMCFGNYHGLMRVLYIYISY